jgi:hypothetical protein
MEAERQGDEGGVRAKEEGSESGAQGAARPPA